MRVSEGQLSELRAAIRSGAYDGSISARAQIVLWHHEGHRKVDIAEMSGASRPTVDKWIGRYAIYGIDGLAGETSPGGRRTIPGRIRGRVLALTRQTPPAELGISHWSAAKMAAYVKRTEGVPVSQPWVSRLWEENGLQPWRQGTFKISKDPRFEEKVRDVTDLYLSPPEGEAVVSVDVKTGIQALDRTQPLLPAAFGKSEKRTHDYRRNGTTDMYAGFDIVTGKVVVELSPTHNAQDFLRLMRKIVRQHKGQEEDSYSAGQCDGARVRGDQTVAGGTGRPGHLSFHADRGVVDEPGRDLEWHHHPSADPARHLLVGQGP